MTLPMINTIRFLAFTIFIRPFFHLWLGARVCGLENIPRRGPVIIVANHESHLDALFILSMLHPSVLRRARAAAAADRFYDRSFLGWVARVFIGLLPIDRNGETSVAEKMSRCRAHVGAGGVLVIFPAGTRGAPDSEGTLKSGWIHVVESFPDTPVVPVAMCGLGRALPKGSFFPLPLLASAVVGAPLHYEGSRTALTTEIARSFHALKAMTKLTKNVSTTTTNVTDGDLKP